MKKTVQSEAKGENVSQEQHELQEQVEQQTSQAAEQSEMPGASLLSPSSSVSDVAETSQGAQDTERPHEEHDVEETAASPQPYPARKRKRKIEAVSEEEIMPRPSYWPLALAISLVILLFGTIAQPIIMVIGAILFIGSIIGWFVERR